MDSLKIIGEAITILLAVVVVSMALFGGGITIHLPGILGLFARESDEDEEENTNNRK